MKFMTGAMILAISTAAVLTACTHKDDTVVANPPTTTVRNVDGQTTTTQSTTSDTSASQGTAGSRAAEKDIGFDQNRSNSTTENGAQAPVADSGQDPKNQVRPVKGAKDVGFDQNRSNSTTEGGSQAAPIDSHQDPNRQARTASLRGKDVGFNQNRSNSTTEGGRQAPTATPANQ